MTSLSADKEEDEDDSVFGATDLDEIDAAMNGKQPAKSLKWRHIASCVEHEMYSKLGSALRAIITETGRDKEEIDEVLQSRQRRIRTIQD